MNCDDKVIRQSFEQLRIGGVVNRFCQTANGLFSKIDVSHDPLQIQCDSQPDGCQAKRDRRFLLIQNGPDRPLQDPFAAFWIQANNGPGHMRGAIDQTQRTTFTFETHRQHTRSKVLVFFPHSGNLPEVGKFVQPEMTGDTMNPVE